MRLVRPSEGSLEELLDPPAAAMPVVDAEAPARVVDAPEEGAIVIVAPLLNLPLDVLLLLLLLCCLFFFFRFSE